MKAEIEALTGIRFFASLWVLLYHAGDLFVQPLFPDIWPAYKSLFYGGGLGVDLFFVLSGFIIAYNYYDEFASFGLKSFDWKKYRGFLFRRFARIYPVHLITLLTMLLVGGVAAQGNFLLFGSALGFVKHIFLLHAFIPPYGWNTVAWSISCEWLAYSLFPIYIFCSAFFKTRLSILVAMIIAYALAIFVAAILATNGYGFTHPSFGVIRVVVEFGAGVLIFKLSNNLPLFRLSKWMRVIGVPLLLVLVFLSSHLLVSFLWMIPFFFLLVYLIATGQFFLNTFLSRGWVKYGGRISYSLYMVHGMIMLMFLKLAPLESFIETSAIYRLGYIVAYLLVTMLVTIFIYHFVEEPARRKLLSL